MRITVFSTQAHDRTFLEAANASRGHRLDFVDARLDATALEALLAHGVRLVLLRCAGFNHVDDASAFERDGRALHPAATGRA